MVKLLKAFDPRILVCDPYVQLSAEDLSDGVVQVPLEKLLAQCDVVSLHPRVTPETVSKKLAALAVFSAASFAFALWRTIRSWNATVALRRQWLRNSHPFFGPVEIWPFLSINQN